MSSFLPRCLPGRFFVSLVCLLAFRLLPQVSAAVWLACKAAAEGIEITADGFWLSFSRHHPQGEAMAKRFDKGLQKIRNKGTYKRLGRDVQIKLGLY